MTSSQSKGKAGSEERMTNMRIMFRIFNSAGLYDESTKFHYTIGLELDTIALEVRLPAEKLSSP